MTLLDRILPELAIHINSVVALLALTIQITCLCTPILNCFFIAYLIWIYWFDNKSCDTGARPNKTLRNLKVWNYVAAYFPVKLVKDPKCELKPEKNYLFCIVPHGLLPLGSTNVFVNESMNISKVFPHHQAHLCTLKAFFTVPVMRELLLMGGGISASSESLDYILGYPGGGQLTGLYVGGAQESIIHVKGRYKLVLKNRKGFVRKALQHGAPLVPVISFGEPDTLSQVAFDEKSWVSRMQQTVKKYTGLGLVIPIGRGISFLKYRMYPHRAPVTVYISEPMEVPKIEQPSQEDIDDLHSKFVAKVIELFETHKGKYLENAEDLHLEIL